MHEDQDRGDAERRLIICNLYEHIYHSPTAWRPLNIEKKFLHRKYILKKKIPRILHKTLLAQYGLPCIDIFSQKYILTQEKRNFCQMSQDNKNGEI